MNISRKWFVRLGFVVVTTPGVARAWQLEFEDGSSLIITDQGGFDLPESGQPVTAVWLSKSNETIDYQEALCTNREFINWLRGIKTKRQQAILSSQITETL